MAANTRTVYEIQVSVSVVVDGEHNRALVADRIASALPRDIALATGEPVNFGAVPRVVRATTFRRHGGSWRRVADEQ